MPEQGGSFVDLLFVKSPTEASLEISVCTAAICLLFTSKTLTLTISLKPWSMSRNRYSSDDRACFFLTWQGDKRKEEGRQKYIISFKKKKGITGKGSSFIQVYYTPKGLSYQGPMKATSENRKTGLPQKKGLIYLPCNRELLN